MLDQLQIRNFRMLDDFSVGPLGRVNLIVGRNNSGKSTVLEALRLLAEGGNARFLFSVLGEHDELTITPIDIEGDRGEPSLEALRHLFPGRTISSTDEKSIEIGSASGYRVTLKHLFFELQEEETKDAEGKVIGVRRTRIPVSPARLPEPTGAILEGFQVTLQDDMYSRSFWLDATASRNWLRGNAVDSALRRLAYGFIPTQFVPLDELAAWWDQIGLTAIGGRVIEALGFIDPEVVGLAFVKNPGTSRYPRPRNRLAERIPVVKLRGQAEPVPLNSMGDGMLRVLQLVLAIVPAKGGFLLVDEFENGLHFSVQEKVWRLVFEMASDLDIQVFATTHSWDCIESFARVAKQYPDNGVLFKMSRSRLTSEKNKVIATVYDEERLTLATATDLEVR